ncbi:hypothetical protein BDV96DRAFT_572814 [Lophiotrema nucula]|uniref:Uncharacterized protein n=1 Tax=Lophiotrema nucula TaxID=690887 RepID=A0A6A5ZB65_9PLEO|nr:hypothetical protein BDV96DRAFT_572814 [Lophiotrema nucula]
MYDRGIGASIASLVMRVRIAREADTTWISSVLTLCRYRTLPLRCSVVYPDRL